MCFGGGYFKGHVASRKLLRACEVDQFILLHSCSELGWISLAYAFYKGFYGLTVHEKALEYGVKVTGATVHFVNEIADGGKIIMQKAVEIMDGDTPEVLQRRVMEQAEWIILPKSAELVAQKINNGEL